MKCPVCGVDSHVLDSRTVEDGESVRRRRQCSDERCGFRFTTYERLEQRFLVVVKKDGRPEAYDREKIRRGLELACTKRPIGAERIEQVVGEIETALKGHSSRQIPTTAIGDLVLEYLRELDEVAYLRFASVNRGFATVDDFLQEAQLMDRGT